ncbi:ATP dependent transmembrane transporter protein, partial [Reticulomyxa filosa]
LTPFAMIPFMLFSNFFITTDQIPVYLRWLRNLSIWYYGISALTIEEFQNVQIKDCQTTVFGQPVTITVNGNYVLEQILAINREEKWFFVWMLIVLFFGFRFLAFAILSYRNKLFYFDNETKKLQLNNIYHTIFLLKILKS